MLVKCVQIRSPHHTQNTVKYIHFFRNIVCMMEYVTVDSRPYLWDFLLSQLSIMDSILSVDLQGAQNQFAVRKSIFAVEETEVESMEVDEKEPVDVFLAELFKKLDICILYTIGWISRFYTPIMNSSNAEHLSWLPPLTREAKQQTDLFAQFQPAFDRVLAQDIKSVPLIWMYMTSQDENFLTRILSSLWMIVTRPSQTPNEWKRSHMAACYLAGFLARSNSVTLEVVMKWFGEMTNWCTRYVNEVAGGLSLNSVGTLRHGTFYAVCQAVFLAFCFRYKQIVEADDLGTVQKWGLGHIVHSYLCPLMYINRPVALCFSAISRSLQLVYCNHLLSHIEESERPFESTFPFDTCFLPMCGEFLSGCLQKFSPMQNDITLISRELTRGSQYNANLKTESADDGAADDEDAFDFMYEDDDDIADVIHVSGGKSLPMSIPPRSQTFTQYSQSPGLRTMEFV
ncbi:hypothetical protein L596_024262 [Steinernema carpocapsae]|nr:hypothetical protein L596_024262 [Steinernema carpocapsae]